MALIGIAIVTQNIVGGLFNSHLFDFTQGWFYVFGVGVLGGALSMRDADDAMIALPAAAAHSGRGVATDRRRAADDAAGSQPAPGLAGRQIDMLVFADTAGILEGNPDIDRVITMPVARDVWRKASHSLRSLAQRYDLAVSTQSGDRPTLFAARAGRTSVAPVEARAR